MKLSKTQLELLRLMSDDRSVSFAIIGGKGLYRHWDMEHDFKFKLITLLILKDRGLVEERFRNDDKRPYWRRDYFITEQGHEYLKKVG